MPVEVDVDSDVTELLVELRPVDSDPIELFADERPVEAEVDSEEMLLDVAVDSEPMELFADEMPVDADVESDVTELLGACQEFCV
ncbi:hypothetical protein FEP63_06365 [Burkholderia multivorans]|nr:hypothetical protein [Burkholderia multivorans]MDR8884162.1 hypothetical protein [Burkholderia multivorans]MDR8890667.1 hypothetical protein [Burkholderia multivorans]MDR8896836.1 hypothetical protein [Burkholderia multivorans]MDR8903015.1 hypothetical protein [Burkholderia multivorans]